MSAVSQNPPGMIEIKGLKTSHFKEKETALLGLGEPGAMGHVECPGLKAARRTRTKFP